MDENASRAVFLGVSVFIAIITITLIVNFYTAARNTAAVANRFDITNTGNKRADSILSKSNITGVELRYLLNYYYNDDSIRIIVAQPEEIIEKSVAQTIDINNAYKEDFWSEAMQQYLDEAIRPNYNYKLSIDITKDKYIVVATFEN